MVQKTAQLITP